MKIFDKLFVYTSVSMLALTMAASAVAQDSAQQDQGQSQDTSKDKDKDKKKDDGQKIEEIIITGSLIPRTTNLEVSPVTVVDSNQMDERGLMSLGAVMKSMTENSGYTEGKASNLLGRFTTGAEEVNMRGLGTGRTLVMVNGRRVADYPLPFGGEQNGVDIGTIPQDAIARVEYLSSGASAIYGSDAIGGVVNLITKRDMEQTLINVTTGAYEQGFGEMLDGSVITGNSYERGSFTLGFQGTSNEQILANDVDYLKENAPYNASMISIMESDLSGQHDVVPASSCAPLGFEFDGKTCTQELSHTISVNPEFQQESGFFDGRFDLTDDIELFATAMASTNSVKTRSNILFWDGVVGTEDQTTSAAAATFLTRGFSDDELGTSNVHDDQDMWTATVGAKGGFDVKDDTWYWDFAYSDANYKTETTTINLKEEGIKNWILYGATSVTDSPDQQYTYFVDQAFYDNQLIDNIVRPVQSSEINDLIGENIMRAESTAQSVQLTLNGTLGDWKILAGEAKFALRAEYGTESTEINPDARSLDTTGHGWYNIGAISSDGKRDRSAIGTELELPVLDDLDVSLAARYDYYDDDSDITGRGTTQVKFLYRATDWLKVRGGYSQTFRAPDMFNIYGQSDAFQAVPDFMAPGCYENGTYSCGFSTVATTRQADTGLTEEHGDDVGLGIIWTPITDLVATVDWYRIRLDDLVVTENPQDLTFKEWQCANGELDPASHLCEDVNSRIHRNGFGAIDHIIVQPINQDNLERQGVDVRASYNIDFAKIGSFNASLSYSKVLEFELTRFAGDEPIDLKYGEAGQSQPGNITGASLGWFNPLTTGKAINMGLYVQRYGDVYNFAHTQFMDPMYSVNLTAGYQFNAKTSALLSINNVFDEQPQDNGSGIWPGYWAHLQTPNALGRSAYLSLGYSFD